MRNKIKSALIILLMTAYLAYQIILLTAIFRPDFSSRIGNALYTVSYGITAATYLILAVLIIVELQNLEEFHIDKFTLLTFILFSLLRRRLGVVGESFFLGTIGFSGVAVAVVLIVKKPRMFRTKFNWVVVGLICAVSLVILATYTELQLRDTWALTPLLRDSIPLTAVSQIIKDISSSALLEEMLFRGFIWGYLRRKDWAENKIFWAQNLLFWLIHMGRLVTPFSFFILIPLLSFISSKLTYHSKQIFPAIISHTAINAIGAMLNLATF